MSLETKVYLIRYCAMVVVGICVIVLLIVSDRDSETIEERNEEKEKLAKALAEAEARWQAKQNAKHVRRVSAARKEILDREREARRKAKLRAEKEREAAESYENDQFFAKYGEIYDEL